MTPSSKCERARSSSLSVLSVVTHPYTHEGATVLAGAHTIIGEIVLSERSAALRALHGLHLHSLVANDGRLARGFVGYTRDH